MKLLFVSLGHMIFNISDCYLWQGEIYVDIIGCKLCALYVNQLSCMYLQFPSLWKFCINMRRLFFNNEGLWEQYILIIIKRNLNLG